ncbi:Uncharacterised protein [Yersinia rohdei]|uniref:Autotransporter protein n=1 Tax=Yersinia rohdei TaxID=29485 RepID=A0A0U1HXE1_YERRO|nr:hypothetical protein [Yersinia rohdei]CNE29418.1 Uncharacterised protein [Yersinia rohdei]CNJ35158.1 Uncharacterised protein [Yersinia rohdei]CQI96603.1 Uncharacterised protein [Yersinia rohdei]CQJ45984.1 Uncharacterised protein [Yersinia rohdei]
MRKFKKLAIIAYRPTWHSSISGVVFLLGLSVAQATSLIIDNGQVHNQGAGIPSDISENLYMGETNTDTLNIFDGGRISNRYSFIDNQAGSSGTATV